jgi:hypothetical protein
MKTRLLSAVVLLSAASFGADFQDKSEAVMRRQAATAPSSPAPRQQSASEHSTEPRSEPPGDTTLDQIAEGAKAIPREGQTGTRNKNEKDLLDDFWKGESEAYGPKAAPANDGPKDSHGGSDSRSGPANDKGGKDPSEHKEPRDTNFMHK